MSTATSPRPSSARRRAHRAPHRWWLGPLLASFATCALVLSLSAQPATAAPAIGRAPAAAQTPQRLTPQVHNAAKHDTSPALRTLKPTRDQAGTALKEMPVHQVPRGTVNTKAKTGR